ncbi:MAG: biopolymer transporter ExbD [bacterium]|nr:biopolymer transporter ExbD [bacterium]
MAFAPSKGKKHHFAAPGIPNLTSMIDIMVVILLFLLKSYSTSGVLVQPAQGVELPNSTVTNAPMKVLTIIAKKDGLFEEVSGIPGKIIEDFTSLQNDNLVELPNLAAMLEQVQQRSRALGREDKTTITIQGDKTIPYRWVLKIINTCASSGFDKVDFVVLKESKYRG